MTAAKMQLEDCMIFEEMFVSSPANIVRAGLDDLCVRFIINLPHEELQSVERICFQVEEAQWFYEDFIRPLDPALPSLSLRPFALRMFQHCPLMSQWSQYHHITAFSEFLAYKTRVPVRGAILLNQEMDEVVLVKGWKKNANWSFPRGKINKGEKDLDCAIREVYEETGFDVREANLFQDDDLVKYIEITMREQHMRLYVFRGVPRDTHFAPRTRKEISKIEWYKLSELPTLKKNKHEGLAVANANKFYMVAPFLHPLKKWIAQQKKLEVSQTDIKVLPQVEGYPSMDMNGHHAFDVPTPLASGLEWAASSNLPEVASKEDASSQLKRLFNIGGAVPVTAQTHSPVLDQPTAVNHLKSNALLELLRRGSKEPVNCLNESIPALNTHPGPSQQTQAPYLPANFFPGFPRQQNISPSLIVAPPHYPNGLTDTDFRHTNFQQGQFPLSHHSELSGSIVPQSQQMYESMHNSVASSGAPLSAPFRQTGDPQFSQPAQPQDLGARVPNANNLPPPKLTSHSLALLGFFKDNVAKARVNSTPMIAASSAGSPHTGKTSQHQDSLLNLFKARNEISAPLQPAELAGVSVPPATVAEFRPTDGMVSILKRIPQPVYGRHQHASEVVKAGQTSATVPGPMDMPQFDSITQPTLKKTAKGTPRRKNGNRREPSPQQQHLSSPIKILARPKPMEESTNGYVQSPTTEPVVSEKYKQPFQPKILRRSEKTTPEKTGLETALQSEELTRQEAEWTRQNTFDRRPSTATQKETLLSLFAQASAPQSAR
ncbi:hypothetical protein N7495_005152 [Penicillium taxi]|uniref:uncharacterized protein n=1 Tax=Penicillium taxi TaxID=168475 RepID=UPI0025457F7F|nr:uncharacterized protein N7495_005152 [Penicillium taxi]KAJ5893461.1 hypothetical protein N7495_005152 [Penicillium taxi]